MVDSKYWLKAAYLMVVRREDEKVEGEMREREERGEQAGFLLLFLFYLGLQPFSVFRMVLPRFRVGFCPSQTH
jgi:hypothetical protein